MELVVSLLVVWAIMIPFRFLYTWLGRSRCELFVVFLVAVVVVGVTRHFDVPGRWMEAVERSERVKTQAAQKAGDGGPKRVLDRSAAPKGRERLPRPAPQLEEERERAAAARARERYEAEQGRLGQSFGDADRTDGSTHGR